mgnify:CR=1 FL=1
MNQEISKRYAQRGVSASKEDVHNAIKNVDKGLFPQAFCKIVPDYLTGDKTPSDLLNNFVNKNGLRYATAAYEGPVRDLAMKAKQMAEPVYASLNKTSTSDIA